MAILTGQILGKVLCESLGLSPDRVKKIALICEPEAVARLEIHTYAVEIDRILTILHSYDIVERKEEPIG